MIFARKTEIFAFRNAFNRRSDGHHSIAFLINANSESQALYQNSVDVYGYLLCILIKNLQLWSKHFQRDCKINIFTALTASDASNDCSFDLFVYSIFN